MHCSCFMPSIQKRQFKFYFEGFKQLIKPVKVNFIVGTSHSIHYAVFSNYQHLITSQTVVKTFLLIEGGACMYSLNLNILNVYASSILLIEGCACMYSLNLNILNVYASSILFSLHLLIKKLNEVLRTICCK